MGIFSLYQYMMPTETHPGLEVRPIRNLMELQQVYRLTHDCYVEKGYIQPRTSQLLAHYPEFDHIKETTILVAVLDNEIVGSISYTLEGPCGFVITKDYSEACDQVRSEGRQLANAWRLVIKKSCREGNKVLMALVTSVVSTLWHKGITTCFLDVHKKHESAYKRLLNMIPVARQNKVAGLEQDHIDAVLMRCDIERLPKKWLMKSQTTQEAPMQQVLQTA